MTESADTPFPPGFLWGVAIGAHQSEGGNVASDAWWRENQPGSAAERCGDAIDSLHRWPEDLDLAAGAGFTDYRFGIEWARIEPADGFISRAAVDHYARIVEGALARGLTPMATLYHFTLPQWFSASGGWSRPDAVERFLAYIDAIAPVLETGVARVMTINEPNIVAIAPLLSDGATDLTDGIPVPDPALSAAMISLHRAAAAHLRSRHPGLAVGWGVSVQDYRALPDATDADVDAYAEPRDQVFLRASAGDDFVGVQTYTGGMIGPGGVPAPDATIARTLTGWEYRPDALGGAVARVARVIPTVPVIVTENGIATADDAQRIAYTSGALASLRAAMEDGADVRGYFHWSLLDNWEWGHWTPTFGLVAVDRETFRRTPKPSLEWLGAQAPSRVSGVSPVSHPAPVRRMAPPPPAHLSAAARAMIERPVAIPLQTPAVDDVEAWAQLVAAWDEAIGATIPRLDLPVRSDLVEHGGVPVWEIIPADADSEGPVYLDIHGGGLILGGGDLVRVHGEFGAMNSGVVHWAVDYRMPPRHPFPAPVDDLVTVYRALLECCGPDRVVVGGGSAGGNLAAALAVRVRDEGLPLPAGLILLTPEVDLTESGDSFTTLADVSVDLQSLAAVNRLYADGRDLAHPMLSPLFAELTGLPPTLLVTGTRDLYLSNTVRMHRALREAGVVADLHVIDGRPHSGFWTAAEEEPVNVEIRSFIRAVTARR